MADYNVINIINFIRGIEPRNSKMDLIEPLKNHIKYLKRLKLNATFLVEHQALLNREMTDILKALNTKQFELGCWFEIDRALVESIGLNWQGRWDWEYLSNVAFDIGYTPAQRERLVDCYFHDFKSVFGYYPSSMGSWMLSASTIAYVKEKYGIKAVCMCRDQYGTDGYSLWGGYYNQGYFPSKYNILCPAQNSSNQINVPVFRMLGSDPIRQYDDGIVFKDGNWKASPVQHVVTMEPVYQKAGGNPDFVDWYLENNTMSEDVGFSYVQIGQENSFGWEAMKRGITYQYYRVKELADKGILSVEKLSDTGNRYISENNKSAVCSQTFDSFDGDGKCLWYNSPFYRINLIFSQKSFYIRDFHLFFEKYEERYLNDTVKTKDAYFDTTPVMDGYRFTGGPDKAGLYFKNENYENIQAENVDFKRISADDMKVTVKTSYGNLVLYLHSENFEIESDFNCILEWIYGQLPDTEMSVTAKSINYTYRGFNYSLYCNGGEINNSGEYKISVPRNKRVLIQWNSFE